MKFGGTSVGTAQSIQSVAKIVKARVSQQPIVVVSAVAGITDALIDIYHERSAHQRLDKVASLAKKHTDIIKELEISCEGVDALLQELTKLAAKNVHQSPAMRDKFVSFGERLSARIVAALLQKNGVDSIAYDAWDVGMYTTSEHGNSEPLPETPAALKSFFQTYTKVPVITGFIGKTKKGAITTLGRGGSDYTTAIIGGSISAAEIQIWKEVDGVLSTDPRVVSTAKLIPTLQYEEAGELAYFGAKVLHPKTMLPAMEKGVPVRVLNTFKPRGKGTLIQAQTPKNTSKKAKAITSKKGTTVITVHSPDFFDGTGLMARMFRCFEEHDVAVDVIATSVVSVSCSYASSAHTPALVESLQTIGAVEVTHNCAVVCVVGAGMHVSSVMKQACATFEKMNVPVRMISESATGVSITFIVTEDAAQSAVIALHKTLIA
jgi:aspartate kinase